MTASTPHRRFRLKRLIGRGSFGEVYLAEQDSGSGFRRPVALKLLDAHASRSREISRRMRDEARLLGRLSSRHIVDVFDLVLLDDRWAVVMEYVPGADLEQVLRWLEPRGEALSGAATMEVVAGVAKALVTAWSADDGEGRPLHVVHRDLKPANIRLAPDGEVKVLDFGVARFTLEEREASTRKPGWLGTERYMAPERILLEGDGPAGDVYALGATAIELILGRPLGRTPVREAPHQAMVDAALEDVAARLEGDEADRAAALALLRAMVAARPEERPEASAVVAAAVPLARRLGGVSLAQIAATLPADVGGSETVAPIVMEERSGGSSSDRPAPSGEGLGAPLPPEEHSPAPPTALDARDETSPDEDGRWRMLWVLPVVWAAMAVFMFLPSPRGAAPEAPPLAPPVAVAGAADPAVAAPTVAGAGEAEGAAAGARAVLSPAAVATPSSAPAASAPEALAGSPGARPPSVSPAELPTATPTRPVAPPAAPAPRSTAVAPAAAPAEVAAPSDAPRVTRAQVVVDDVEAFSVRCGDRAAEGTVSARITDFPGGACVVRASVGGRQLQATVQITGPREVRCRVDGEALRCS